MEQQNSKEPSGVATNGQAWMLVYDKQVSRKVYPDDPYSAVTTEKQTVEVQVLVISTSLERAIADLRDHLGENVTIQQCTRYHPGEPLIVSSGVF